MRDQCEGKLRHLTREDAAHMVSEMRRMTKEVKRRAKRLAPYFCTSCGYFHVGHNRRPKTIRRNKRAGR